MKALKSLTVITAVLILGVLFAAVFTASEAYAAKGDMYLIDYDPGVQNGVVFCPSIAASGETVTVTTEPDAGRSTGLLTVYMDSRDNLFQYEEEVPGIRHPDPNTIEFEMPDANVKVMVEFTEADEQLVFICDMEGGTVETDHTVAKYRDRVLLTIVPDNGYVYVPESLKLYEVDPYTHEEQEMSRSDLEDVVENSQYAFTVRSRNVYVRAEFEEETPEETKYTVHVAEDLENGSLSVDETSVPAGWKVTVTAKPDTNHGFVVKSLTVTGSGGDEVKVTAGKGGKYTFTMPEEDVFVTAVFEEPIFGISAVSEDVDILSGRETGARIEVPEEETAGHNVQFVAIIPQEAELVELTVKGDDSGKEITWKAGDHSDGSTTYHYSFTMPEEPVTVTGKFTIKKYKVTLAEGFRGEVSLSVGGEPLSLPGEVEGREELDVTYSAPKEYDLRSLKFSFPRGGQDSNITLDFTQEEDNVYRAKIYMPEADITLVAELIEEIHSWSTLQAALDAAGKGQTVKMFCDITAASGDGPLQIKEGHDVILDLNGHRLDRRLAAPKSGGYVIRVDKGGIFALEDNSEEQTGVLTGGYSDGNGGGIYSEGHVLMRGGTITGNKAVAGGGVYIVTYETTYQPDNGKFHMYGGRIIGNEAQDGAGIYVSSNAHFYGKGGLIQGNTATGNGGGILMKFGHVSIGGDLTIDGNTAVNGGGIARQTYRDLVMDGGKITNNTATGDGGGIYLQNNCGGFALYNMTLAGNSAGDDGGAIYLADNAGAWIENVTMENNSSASRGGAIYVGFNNVEHRCFLGKCTLKNNFSKDGGAILTLGITIMENTKVQKNRAANDGGGISCRGTVDAKKCEFYENTAENNGGVFIEGAKGNLSLTDCIFMINEAQQQGGILYMEASDTIEATLMRCSLEKNKANMGGAICSAGKGMLILRDCYMFENRVADRGGAIYNRKTGLKMYLMNVEIENNISGKAGGGIMAEGTMIGMSGKVLIVNNKSEQMKDDKNLCLDADACITNPSLSKGSRVFVSVPKRTPFLRMISQYQLQYFITDKTISLMQDALNETPIYGSVFGEGAALPVLIIGGASAAVAAAVILRKKQAEKKSEKEETQEKKNDKEETAEEGKKDED